MPRASLTNPCPTPIPNNTAIPVDRPGTLIAEHITMEDLRDEFAVDKAYTHPSPHLTGLGITYYTVDADVNGQYLADQSNFPDPVANPNVFIWDDSGQSWYSKNGVWDANAVGKQNLTQQPYIAGTNGESELIFESLDDMGSLVLYVWMDAPTTETNYSVVNRTSGKVVIVSGSGSLTPYNSDFAGVPLIPPNPSNSTSFTLIGRQAALSFVKDGGQWSPQGDLSVLFTPEGPYRAGWGNGANVNRYGVLQRFTLDEEQYEALSADDAIQLTYTELKALVDSGTLVGGCTYRMTDFQTIHTIKGTATVNYGPTEQISFLALDNYTLHPCGTIRGDTGSYKYIDLVEYEFVSTMEEWQMTVGDFPKGRITHRRDTLRNIEAFEDFRAVKYRRYSKNGAENFTAPNVSLADNRVAISITSGSVLTGAHGKLMLTIGYAAGNLFWRYNSYPDPMGFLSKTDGTHYVTEGISIDITGTAYLTEGDQVIFDIDGGYWYWNNEDDDQNTFTPAGYMDFYMFDNTPYPNGDSVHVGKSYTGFGNTIFGFNRYPEDYLQEGIWGSTKIDIGDCCEDFSIGRGCSVLRVSQSFGNLRIKDGCHHINIGTCGDGTRIGANNSSIMLADNTHAYTGNDCSAITVGEESWVRMGNGCLRIQIDPFTGLYPDLVVLGDNCTDIKVNQYIGGLTIPASTTNKEYIPTNSVVGNPQPSTQSPTDIATVMNIGRHFNYDYPNADENCLMIHAKVDRPSNQTAGAVRGYSVQAETPSSNTNNVYTLNGGYQYVKHAGSGTASQLKGIQGWAESVTGAGAVNSAITGGQFWGRCYSTLGASGVVVGSESSALVGTGATGTFRTAYGSVNYAGHNSVGTTLTDLFGVMADCYCHSTNANTTTNITGFLATIEPRASTVTNAYGVRVNSTVSSGVGTLANFYGLYVDTIQSGTAKWGVYQVASAEAKNYFGNTVMVGNTADDGSGAVLQVNGKISAKAELLLNQTSAVDPRSLLGATASGLTIANSTANRINMMASASNSIIAWRYNGTLGGAMTPVADTNYLLVISAGGAVDSTGGFTNLNAAVGVTMQAAETWSTTARGTRIFFQTTGIGSTATATRMTISHTGNVLISGSTTEDAGLEKLQVTGAILATTTIKQGVYTVATLPTNAGGVAATAGTRAFISDSVATHAAGIGLAPTGGGSNFVPVYHNGSGWRIG